MARALAYFVAGALLAFGASSLAGCASTPQDHAAACNSYGFQRGTADWAHCLQAESIRADANRQAQAAALQRFGSSLQQQSQSWAQQRATYNAQQRAAVPYTPTFRCFPMAGYVQCR